MRQVAKISNGPNLQHSDGAKSIAQVDNRPRTIQAKGLQAAIGNSPRQVAQRANAAPIQLIKKVVLGGVLTEVPDDYQVPNTNSRFPGQGLSLTGVNPPHGYQVPPVFPGPGHQPVFPGPGHQLGSDSQARQSSEDLVRMETIAAAGNNFQARPSDFGLPRNYEEMVERRGGREATVRPIPGQEIMGKSTFADSPNNSMAKGKLTRLEHVPQGLGVVADGADVGGTHSHGHRTIYPREPMSFREFNNRLTGEQGHALPFNATKGHLGEITDIKPVKNDQGEVVGISRTLKAYKAPEAKKKPQGKKK